MILSNAKFLEVERIGAMVIFPSFYNISLWNQMFIIAL